MSINFFYNHLSFYILVVFTLALVVQLCIHWIRFSRLAFTMRRPAMKPDDALEPVSVVVCARDAYEHLTELIPALLSQDYPDFEDVPMCYFLKGNSLELNSQIEEAKAAYEEFLAKYPDHYMADQTRKMLPHVGSSNEEMLAYILEHANDTIIAQ